MPTPKETALSACRQLMEPIIGILLRNGITHKDLATLCKQIYVQVASEEFGIRGRQTNLSRVAMLTGIDRKEAARIKESLQNNDESKTTQHNQDRLTRVLSGWHQDADFIDATGKPLAMPAEGDLPSFAQLARRYGGDMPVSALLKELKLNGIVEEDDAGQLRPLKRYFVPAQSDPGALLRAGSVFNDLGSTLHHNLYKAHTGKQQPLHFERRATNSHMSSETSAAFRAFVEQEGQAFLEKIDAWLTAHEQPIDHNSENNNDSNPPIMRLGVGAYLIQNMIEPNAVNTKTVEQKIINNPATAEDGENNE